MPGIDGPLLVSMVVPSFRQGRFLRPCLESLLAQSYPHVEVIVRDNLSDDGTASVLEEFRGRVTVVRERDAGQADALRKGFAQARGAVLGWLNADDLLCPRALEMAVAALETSGHPDVVYGHCAFIDDGGDFQRYFDDVLPFSAHELLNYSDFIPQPSTFFRREAYERVGGLDATLCYAMDWDLWCRFAAAGLRFLLVPDVLSAARLHPGAKTATGGWGRMVEVTRVNNRHRTLPMPMVPILYAASLYSERLKPWIGPLHRPLRWLWGRLTGRRRAGKAPVFGLRGPRDVVCPEFSIRFPVYRALDGVRLILQGLDGNGVDPRVGAWLNGDAPTSTGPDTAGAGHVLEWRFNPTSVLPEIRIEASVEAPIPPGLSLSVELVPGAPPPARPDPTTPFLSRT